MCWLVALRQTLGRRSTVVSHRGVVNLWGRCETFVKGFEAGGWWLEAEGGGWKLRLAGGEAQVRGAAAG